MGYTQGVKAMAVAAVLAMIVVVAVFPLTDMLQQGTAVADMRDNDPACLVTEAAEGYETEIALVGTTDGGIRSASLTVDGEALVLYGSDARIWLMDTGAVLATAYGLYTPFDPDGASDGTTVAIASGTVTSGESSQGYGLLLVPSETGTLGLYVEPFRITSLSSFYAVAGQHVGYGQVSEVVPTSEGDAGTFSVDSTASGEGYSEVSGASYTEGGAEVQATAFVAPVSYYAGIEEGEAGVASSVMSVVPVIILVGLLAFVAVTFGGRR